MAEDQKDRHRLALLAHDLRTPLSAMRTTAGLIGQGDLDSGQRANLDLLLRSIDALSDMAGELVSSARPGDPRPGPACDAAKLVRDTAGLFRPLADARGLSLDVDVSGDGTGVDPGQAGSLRRVVSALIDNAIKYTPAGRVSVSMTVSDGSDPDDRALEIAVEDTGPGIDAEEKARLFNPFVRGKAGEACCEGAGLGLWGARQLIEEVGGTLRHTNLPEAGSRFEVTLTARDNPVTDVSVEAAPDTAPDGPLGGHFLVVDDNETNRRLMAALLESFGSTFETAENGEAAAEKARAGDFDAVLLDLHMPGESGLDVAVRLAANREGAPLPVIAVTASLEAVSDRQLHEAGFVDVLTKPLSPADLYRALVEARTMQAGAGEEIPLSRSAS